MDINKFIFSRTQPDKKMDIINGLSKDDLDSVKQDTIVRIVKEVGRNYCKSRDKKLRMRKSLMVSNGWNSWFESVSVIKQRPYVNLYVQYGDCDTDGTFSASYQDFFRSGDFRGEIKGTDRYENTKYYYYTYSQEAKRECLRSILEEYVLTKYADKLKNYDKD